jgi:hypothetical protein
VEDEEDEKGQYIGMYVDSSPEDVWRMRRTKRANIEDK